MTPAEIRARLAELDREEAALRRARLDALDQEARQIRARMPADGSGESLLGFVLETHPDYRVGWFHRRVCAALEWFALEVQAGRSPRMMLTAPPRHGKTAIVSQRFPLWAMAQLGGAEVLCASYGQDLADQNSLATRVIARSDEAAACLPDLRSRRELPADRVSYWHTGAGSYKAVGVGGPLTGHGGLIGIIDDPVKDAAEARSATYRQRAWDWFGQVFATRIAPGGGILLMMTRWHEDDLAGRLIRHEGRLSEGGVWRVVECPAIAEHDEPDRKRGEALHVERWPLDRLEALRRTMGDTAFAALYQQRPVPASGGMFRREWFSERYTAAPAAIAATADEVWITADAASKGKAGSDFHAIQVWARKGAIRYLLDRVTERMGLPEFEAVMGDLWNKWGPHVRRSRGGVLVEDAANGSAYLQTHHRQIPNLIGFHPSRDTPGRDKSKGARALYLARAAEAGQVRLPAGQAWVSDWLATIMAFPVGAHDDDVDAASQLHMRWTLSEGAPAGLSDGDAEELLRLLG